MLKYKSTRDGFGAALMEAAQTNDQIIVITADLSESTRVSDFEKAFPDRFVDVGVAEQNLVSVASGIASTGKKVVATSYAMFSPGRNWEQIRTTICYNNQPVLIVGSHAGLATGPDGATHQALEDIALMRVLPNMIVLSPADDYEADILTKEALSTNHPIYLRLSREPTPVITRHVSDVRIGVMKPLRRGDDVTVVATGVMVNQALEAAKELVDEISVEVLNASTLKPFDEEVLIESVKRTGNVITVEDHQVVGGLGSIVSEVTAKHYPVPVVSMGMEDCFGESGKPDELYEKYGMTAKHIVAKIKSLVE